LIGESLGVDVSRSLTVEAAHRLVDQILEFGRAKRLRCVLARSTAPSRRLPDADRADIGLTNCIVCRSRDRRHGSAGAVDVDRDSCPDLGLQEQSWAITRFETTSSIGLPMKMMLSLRRRE